MLFEDLFGDSFSVVMIGVVVVVDVVILLPSSNSASISSSLSFLSTIADSDPSAFSSTSSSGRSLFSGILMNMAVVDQL